MDIVADKSHYGKSGWESKLELFAEVASNLKQWLGTAQEHLYAANVLLPHIYERQNRIDTLMKKEQMCSLSPSLHDTFFMLCALATENSFKSVIASKHHEAIKARIFAKAKLPEILLGHFLVDLAYRAGYEVNLNSEYALRFLTRYGVWGGKYPVPVSNAKYALTEKHSNGEHYLVGGYDPQKISQFLLFGVEVFMWASTKVNQSVQSDQPAAGG